MKGHLFTTISVLLLIVVVIRMIIEQNNVSQSLIESIQARDSLIFELEIKQSALKYEIEVLDSLSGMREAQRQSLDSSINAIVNRSIDSIDSHDREAIINFALKNLK